MPDALLDVVKEEQTRAREAGKNARGGPHGGGIGRGESHACTILVLALIRLPFSQVAVEHHGVCLHPAPLVFQNTDIFRLPRKVVVVHAVVHRVGAGDADAGCDVATVSIRGLPLFMYTATFVIVGVMVHITVSRGMDVDDRLPY